MDAGSEIYVGIGRHKLVKYPDAAERVARRINTRMDQNQRLRKEPFGSGARTRYAKRQSTPALIEAEYDAVQMEKELNIDELTGLHSLRKYKSDSFAALQSCISITPDRNITVDKEKLSRIHFIRLDIGLLSYANTLEGGHETGDKYKAKVAQIVGGNTEKMAEYAKNHAVDFSGYVMTKGDEFGIIARNCSAEQAQELANEIRAEVVKVKISPEARLPASISTGVVSAVEFIDKYLNFEKEVSLPNTEEFHKRYYHFLDGIADFKAEYTKAVERIDLLCKLYIGKQSGEGFGGNAVTDEDFHKYKFHAARGAFGIDDSTLDDLSRETNEEMKKQKTALWVKSILRKRNQTAYKREHRRLDIFILEVKRNLIAQL